MVWSERGQSERGESGRSKFGFQRDQNGFLKKWTQLSQSGRSVES